MGDTDFPIAMGGQGGSPYQPYVPPIGPSRPTQPAEGFDEFRRKHGLPAKDPKGFAKGYAYQLGEYEQAGTEVPPLRIQDEALKGFGIPLQTGMSISSDPTFETLLAGSPSFDINKGTGSLGRRTGEQLLRLQQGSGEMKNQQLQQELERRGIMPRGVQLPLI